MNFLYFSVSLFIFANSVSSDSMKNVIRRQRLQQETVSDDGLCSTMAPPSTLAPDNSTCWDWFQPPPDGVLQADDPAPPTGCDYKPCEDAVCACDSYCCTTAWDLSCRGYYVKSGDTLENNYFVPGCSAKLLCCEQETAFPDPPIGAALPLEEIQSIHLVSIPAPPSNFNVDVDVSISLEKVIEYQICESGSPGCCDTLIPPSYVPPDDSTCWQWWDPPADGIMKPGSTPPPKGCDYKPCQDAVCACDSYCCETAWDLSCRGYEGAQGDSTENNYFVDNCSARMLCCEPESAFPDPPVGGAFPPILSVSTNTSIIVEEKASYECERGSANCCETMIPPSYLPPDNSTCWQWWDPPADGVMKSGSPPPPKGCDYKPCQDAVCACDSYCCETAWDLSCRGYEGAQGDSTENNYFVDNCSAKILCCEPESAYPDPPVGGATVSKIEVTKDDSGTAISVSKAEVIKNETDVVISKETVIIKKKKIKTQVPTPIPVPKPVSVVIKVVHVLELTDMPSSVPTSTPSALSTDAPSAKPTRRPTYAPTKSPTRKPIRRPTPPPTITPTNKPTRRPIDAPTKSPTRKPTSKPTRRPTNVPTKAPTDEPTSNPSHVPTNKPTNTVKIVTIIKPVPVDNPVAVPVPNPIAVPVAVPSPVKVEYVKVDNPVVVEKVKYVQVDNPVPVNMAAVPPKKTDISVTIPIKTTNTVSKEVNTNNIQQCACQEAQSISATTTTYKTTKSKGKSKKGSHNSKKGSQNSKKASSSHTYTKAVTVSATTTHGYYISNGCKCPCLCQAPTTNIFYATNENTTKGKSKNRARRDLGNKKCICKDMDSSISYYATNSEGKSGKGGRN